ncbi:MAG TPA: TonB-dependent receptor [Myxococcota bacterium]|nr:TonB-dependent receptor [Myxococcota bacterium]
MEFWRFRAALVALLALVLGASPFGVAGEIAESAADPSSFTTVIDATEYDERFATVEELLSQVPGTRVRRFGGLGAQSTVSIRGSKAEQVLVLLDGVRMNSSSRGAADLSTIPVRQVARIEVIRGGGAARFGSDAVGGVILITTRGAAANGLHADAALAAGGQTLRGGDVAFSGAGDRGSALVTYSRLSSKNDFEFDLAPTRGDGAPQTFTRLNANFAEDSGLFRGTLRAGATSRFDATVDLYQKRNGQPGSALGRARGGAEDDDISCISADEDYRRGIARLAFANERLLRGAFEIAGSVRSDDSRLDDPAGGCGFISPFVTGGRDHASWLERESQLESRWAAQPLGLGFVSLSGSAVAGLRYTTVDSSDADLHRRTSVAASLLPEIALFDATLRLFPALGVETADTSSGLARSAAFRAMVPVKTDDSTAWLPAVGAIVQVSPGFQLKANWKRVLRRPTFTELFHPDWSFVRGNPSLEPEKGWNADVGFELASDGAGFVRGVRVQASLFQRELEQGIEWLLNTNRAYMPVNTGRARALGAEISIESRLWNRLELAGTYTYTKARYLRPEPGAAFGSGVAPIFPHSPENAVTARAALDLGALEPWTEVRYESEFAYQVGRQTLAPAATVLDAGLIFRPARLRAFDFLPEALTLSVEASNLLREQRVDSLGQPLSKEALWVFRIRGATP